MKKFILNFLFALPLLMFVSCSNSDKDDNGDNDLQIIGTWDLTRYEIVEIKADDNQTVLDITRLIEADIDELSSNLEFKSDESLVATDPSEGTSTNGTYTLNGTTLAITAEGETMTFTDVTVSGNILSWNENRTEMYKESYPKVTNAIIKYIWTKK